MAVAFPLYVGLSSACDYIGAVLYNAWYMCAYGGCVWYGAVLCGGTCVEFYRPILPEHGSRLYCDYGYARDRPYCVKFGGSPEMLCGSCGGYFGLGAFDGGVAYANNGSRLFCDYTVTYARPDSPPFFNVFGDSFITFTWLAEVDGAHGVGELKVGVYAFRHLRFQMVGCAGSRLNCDYQRFVYGDSPLFGGFFNFGSVYCGCRALFSEWGGGGWYYWGSRLFVIIPMLFGILCRLTC